MNLCRVLQISLLAVILALAACTLEEEPDIPTDVTNADNPIFAPSEIVPDSGNNLLARARLARRGNVNILQHGWVWSTYPAPVLQDSNLKLGKLILDTFEARITGLSLGEPYYLRPFVITGVDTIYGPENCSFVGVDFAINTSTELFQGAIVQFTNTTVNGNIDFHWSFGDGDSSSLASPVHTFNTLGPMTVRLTAKTGNCTGRKDLVLNIVPDPFKNYWASIPGGTFQMGCTPEQGGDCKSEESPVHQVTLSPFFIGKTEVTQGQWRAVTGDDPSYYYQCGSDCPVELVNWNQIVDEFIPALFMKTGKVHRLPTEAEWEYAARGGADASNMTKYAGSDNLDAVAWYFSNSLLVTYPVAQKDPNGYGLYDMSGNVMEWCYDKYPYNYSPAAQTNPVNTTGGGGKKVMRGGSFYSAPIECRVSARLSSEPSQRLPNFGLRLVRQ